MLVPMRTARFFSFANDQKARIKDKNAYGYHTRERGLRLEAPMEEVRIYRLVAAILKSCV